MITLNNNRPLGDPFAAIPAPFQEAAVRHAQPAETQDALDKVENAQANATRTAFRMMDRHNDMVKKSQELSKVRSRQKAIENRNRQNRQNHTDLLAEMAIENAERSKWLNRASWKRREPAFS